MLIIKDYILIIGLAIGLTGCWKEQKNFYARKGVLDLSQENNIELLQVKGEFFFAWQKVLSPQDILKTPDSFLILPDEWNKRSYLPQGFATYSLLIKLPSKIKDIALELPSVATAYRLWLNDSLYFSMGRFSTDPDSSVASYQKAVIQIPKHFLSEGRLQITLNISNYEHFRGGIYYPIYLGTSRAIRQKNQKIHDFELFVMGVLVFMGVFHSILYFFLSRRQRNHDSLYLALICLLVILRTSLISVGSQYWRELFPESSFELMMRTEFFSMYALPLAILLFLNALLPGILPTKLFRIARWVTLLMAAMAFLPIPTYLYSIPLFYVVMCGLYALEVYACFKAKRQGVKEAYLILTAFLMPLIFTFLEILYYQGIIFFSYANITLLGMLLFLFTESFVISYRIAKAFAKVAYLSKNLEREVIKRTRELEEQKEELLQSNIALENAKNEIQKAQESILASIHYAQRIQNAMLPSDKYISYYVKEYFVFYQPRDVVSGDFYWFYAESDTSFYIAAADCTGHGVPGAIMATMAHISLDYAFFRKEYHNLGELLTVFDKELIKFLHKNAHYDEEPSKDGLVIAICKIDLHAMQMQYASANSPVYVVRNGTLIELPCDKYIIGGGSKECKNFVERTLRLEKDDMIYLFSDGYQDQFGGEKKKKMGNRRFRELLQKASSLQVSEQKQFLEKEFYEWKGDYSQIDDILIIGIRIN